VPVRPRIAVVALAAVLVTPSLAAADVTIRVPERFLGGPIWNPVPVQRGAVPTAPAGGPVAPDDGCAPGEADCVLLTDEEDLNALPLGDLEDPARGLAFDLPVPEEVEVDGEEPVAPGGEEEDEPPPDPDPGGPVDGEAAAAAHAPRAPVAVPTGPGEGERARGGLIAPGPAAWLRWQRPVLRWRAVEGADLYNVQIHRGARRVLAAWTRAPRLRVPAGALRQGRTYVWVVWPARGRRASARYGAPVGRSTFALTLRPRIVLHRAGDGRTVGEIRPRIPGARIELRGRGRLRVRANARSLLTLPVPRRAAERLRATLVDRGPRPPVGLRGGPTVPARASGRRPAAPARPPSAHDIERTGRPPNPRKESR
jgi:hypothetical protein